MKLAGRSRQLTGQAPAGSGDSQKIQKYGYRIQNTEYRIQNTEYRIQNTEYRIQNMPTKNRRNNNTVIDILFGVLRMYKCLRARLGGVVGFGENGRQF
jgi:hypothetical protein